MLCPGSIPDRSGAPLLAEAVHVARVRGPEFLTSVVTGSRSPEEAVVHAVVEARRAAPAILYLPHLTLWWDTAPSSLRATLWMLLADLPADLPLMLFATADAPLPQLPHEAMTLFGRAGVASAYELGAPSAEERAAMFEGLAKEAVGPAKQRARKSAPLPPPEVRQ